MHVTMVFVIAGHFLIYSVRLMSTGQWKLGHAWRGMLYGFGLAGLLILQLHALVMPQILSQIGQTTKVQAWNNPFWTVVEMVRGIQVESGGPAGRDGNLHRLRSRRLENAQDIRTHAGPCASSGDVGNRSGIGYGTSVVAAVLLLSGLAALMVVHGLMIMAASLAQMCKLSLAKGLVVGTSLSTMVIIGSAISVPAVYAPKQDYAGALGYVERHRRAEDAVVAVGLARFPYQQFFETNWATAETVQDLNAIRTWADRTWVVMTMPMHLEAYAPEIWRSLRSEFLLQTVFPGTLGDGAVYVYRVDRNASPAAKAQEPSRG